MATAAKVRAAPSVALPPPYSWLCLLSSLCLGVSSLCVVVLPGVFAAKRNGHGHGKGKREAGHRLTGRG